MVKFQNINPTRKSTNSKQQPKQTLDRSQSNPLEVASSKVIKNAEGGLLMRKARNILSDM